MWHMYTFVFLYWFWKRWMCIVYKIILIRASDDTDIMWNVFIVSCSRFSTSATPCTTMTVLLSAWTSTALSVEKEPSLTNKHWPATFLRMLSLVRSHLLSMELWSLERFLKTIKTLPSNRTLTKKTANLQYDSETSLSKMSLLARPG